MENCTVYSHSLCFDRIEQVLRETLPKGDIKVAADGSQCISVTLKGGLFSGKKTLTINYRERSIPSYTLDKGNDPLTNNLRGMYNFVGSISTQHDKVRDLLQQKIATFNCEFACIAEPNFTDELKAAVQNIARQQDAILFAQPGKTFSRSPVQQFLNPEFQVILDTQGYSEVDKVSVQIDSRYFDSPKHATEAQEKRKQTTIAYLKQHGIATIDHLPTTPDVTDVQLRAPQELLERAYALTLIAAKGEGIEPERLDSVKSKLRIDGLSPYESFIYNKPQLDDAERAYSTWRYESLNTLLWVLGLLESLPYPDAICDVSHIVGLMINSSRDALTSKISIRSKEEILNALDVIYRMHWACVNARIKGQSVGGGIDPSVVYERHYALNWVTREGEAEWDDVNTHT